MAATMSQASSAIDYDRSAASYARHRGVHQGVMRAFIASGHFTPDAQVLDVGCGTGNYARALASETGCRLSGVEPARAMLDRARAATNWESLHQARAEQLPFANRSFDVVMSTDVIHHVGDRDAFYREAARVLRPGGHLVTVTDSHDEIPRRRPLSSHFPETVALELARYPATSQLLDEMARAGFVEHRLQEVALDYALTDIQPYRDRAFSSLHLLDEAAFQRGLRRLEADLARGPIPCLSLYTMLWGTVPRI